MYCDCVLGRSGFLPGYVVVLGISAVFVAAALGMMLNGLRRGGFKLADIEASKDGVLSAED